MLVDQRSQGCSDPAPKNTWTVKHMAGDVRALAESLDFDRYAVLGHSYGAIVVLQLAVDYPRASTASVVSHGVPSPRWYRLEEELARFEPNEVRVQIAQAWQELETVTDPERMTELIAQLPLQRPLRPPHRRDESPHASRDGAHARSEQINICHRLRRLRCRGSAR